MLHSTTEEVSSIPNEVRHLPHSGAPCPLGRIDQNRSAKARSPPSERGPTHARPASSRGLQATAASSTLLLLLDQPGFGEWCLPSSPSLLEGDSSIHHMGTAWNTRRREAGVTPRRMCTLFRVKKMFPIIGSARCCHSEDEVCVAQQTWTSCHVIMVTKMVVLDSIRGKL